MLEKLSETEPEELKEMFSLRSLVSAYVLREVAEANYNGITKSLDVTKKVHSSLRGKFPSSTISYNIWSLLYKGYLIRETRYIERPRYPSYPQNQLKINEKCLKENIDSRIKDKKEKSQKILKKLQKEKDLRLIL
jgi:hypothetical protein